MRSKFNIENLKFAVAVSALLFLLCTPAGAQQSIKVFRIGYLSGAALSAIPERVKALQQGLSKLGYVEGKNIVIEWRSAEGDRNRQRALAAELVRLNVDVIVASSGGDTRAAKQATATIPIVMTQSDDPVASGLVASLARPGGNITGFSTLSPETSGKRLELLKELIPKLSRVVMFGTSTSPGNEHELKGVELAAGVFGIKLRYLDVQSYKDFESAFRAASDWRAEAALMNVSGSIAAANQKRTLEHAAKNRLPTIYSSARYVEAGGFMSYGVNLTDLDRRSAIYVDKILKGAKPADLPIEQPTKFELVINLKTAKQIGVTIPQSVLYRADKVIK